MTTKPPSGSRLATDRAVDEAVDDAVGDAIDDIIGDITLASVDKPLMTPSPTPLPISLETPIPTPAPVALETPAPLSLPKAPMSLSAALKTPAPMSLSEALKTPGPTPLGPIGSVKTPAPLPTRDPSSALPSIPPARKEGSGAFPLPGMAPDGNGKSSDQDVTLIARLSVLDDLVEESTKVEPLEAALLAKTKEAKDPPIALADQASAERDRALGVSAAERMSAAEFEEPGDDDELTVSATPGIISITDEDEDEDTTASQRPSGRSTPAPDALRLPAFTPAPVTGGPRLPAPTPPPGRTMRLPTPSAGIPPIPMPLVTSASGPSRSMTPAFPIAAPRGGLAPAAPSALRRILYKTVSIPLGGLVTFVTAMFVLGLFIGTWVSRGETPPPVVADAPAAAPPPSAAPTPTPTPMPAQPENAPAAKAAPEPTPAVAAPAPTPAAEEPKTEAKTEPKAEPKTEPAAETPPPSKPTHHPVAARPKPAVAAAAPKPVVAKPAVAKPAVTPKPAASKHGKAWVDPFAE